MHIINHIDELKGREMKKWKSIKIIDEIDNEKRN
jgi:hypothetical protein